MFGVVSSLVQTQPVIARRQNESDPTRLSHSLVGEQVTNHEDDSRRRGKTLRHAALILSRNGNKAIESWTNVLTKPRRLLVRFQRSQPYPRMISLGWQLSNNPQLALHIVV